MSSSRNFDIGDLVGGFNSINSTVSIYKRRKSGGWEFLGYSKYDECFITLSPESDTDDVFFDEMTMIHNTRGIVWAPTKQLCKIVHGAPKRAY